MERNPLRITAPSWLKIDAGTYKWLLNRTAMTFEILSLQTKEAKGERNAEEFFAYGRAVFAQAESSSTAQR